MKRKLAEEALSTPGESYDAHHSMLSVDEAMADAVERLRRADPHGRIALSLLDEQGIKSQYVER